MYFTTFLKTGKKRINLRISFCFKDLEGQGVFVTFTNDHELKVTVDPEEKVIRCQACRNNRTVGVVQEK